MSDAPVPTPPADRQPTPELIAEVEGALEAGLVDDVGVVYMSQGLHAIWHALSAEDVHAAWWPKLQAEARKVTGDDDAQVYADFARSWNREAGEATQAWLREHRIEKVTIPYFTALGDVLIIELRADGVLPG